MKIRIKFGKRGAMKFVGHLDMMRYFQKAMRRAHIDIRYSEGFSPHPIMSFAAPLGVGITSDGEYLDIEVRTSLPSEEALAALNAVMVEGIEILSYSKLSDTAQAAMSVVAAADYRLCYKEGCLSPYTAAQWQTIIRQEFTENETFLITKKTKKGERTLDLKPLVYVCSVTESETDQTPEFFLRVSTGSTDNVKPELVLSCLYERCGLLYQPQAVQIHRKEVYARGSDGEFLPLEAMGEPVIEAASNVNRIPEEIAFQSEDEGVLCSEL